MTATRIEDVDVQQEVFQSLMQAMAHPGMWWELPFGVSALESVLAALCDPAAGYADLENQVSPRAKLHIGAPVLDEASAPFVVASGHDARAADRQSPQLGSLEDPHLSTTFILLLSEDAPTFDLHLQGPGVPDTGTDCDASGLDSRWLERRDVWVKDYPMGVDLILIRGAKVSAIPRTTRIVSEDMK